MASKEYLHRTPSKKAGREIIWGNHSLEAKERFPQTPSKKTDWVKAKKQEIRLFLRRQKRGRSPERFPLHSLNRLSQAPASQPKQPISYAAHYRRAGQFRQLLQIRRSIEPRNQSKRPRACARPPGKLAAFFALPGALFGRRPGPLFAFLFLLHGLEGVALHGLVGLLA